MPLRKTHFTEQYNDLTKAIDVDDSAGRSLPQNMNFVEEGYLIKDTGYIPQGVSTPLISHSLFNYEKKSGRSFMVRALGTSLQQYSIADRVWYDIVGCPVLTASAQVGYVVYNDTLHFGNAVESLYTWNGTTFTAYTSAPKGNIMTVFEDRLFISGVTAEPLSIYYSNVGVPTTYTGTDLLKPLGTDKVTGLVNYYGTLLIFKQKSIWKLTFVYDQIVSLFVPKLESQSSNYGACSRQSVTWVENDIWFFTGREVRSIGYKDQQIGVLGINNSVISDAIKQTLTTIKTTNFDQVFVFYDNRRFYLQVLLGEDTRGTMFVSHLLYQSHWTKYINRDKSNAGSAVVIGGIIYTSNAFSPFGVVKWTVETADVLPLNVYLTTES